MRGVSSRVPRLRLTLDCLLRQFVQEAARDGAYLEFVYLSTLGGHPVVTVTEYADAFRRSGLDLDATPPDEAGRWLAARTEPVELAGYLDELDASIPTIPIMTSGMPSLGSFLT